MLAVFKSSQMEVSQQQGRDVAHFQTVGIYLRRKIMLVYRSIIDPRNIPFRDLGKMLPI